MILIYIFTILSIAFLSIGMVKRYSLSKKMKKTVNIYKYLILISGVILLSLSLMDIKSEEDTVESNKPLVTYFLIDVSKSMLVEDIKPNRLGIAKEIVRDCINSIRGEFSIITFSNRAYTLVPQTKDRDMTLKFLDAIDKKYIYSGSTDIFNALEMVDKSSKDKKIVVILSDGEDKNRKNYKDVTKDMTIFSVALGTKKGGLIPFKDSFVKDRNGKYVTSKVNINYLASLGSIYSISGNTRDVKKLPEDISNISNKSNSIGEIKIYKRYYQIFLIVAIALLFSSHFMPYIFLLIIISCNEGDKLYNKKEYSKALVEYSKGKSKRDRVGRANSLFMLEKYSDALKIYEELGMEREVANTNVLLSNNRENWEKAESFYREKMLEGSIEDRTIWEYIIRIEPDKIEKEENKNSKEDSESKDSSDENEKGSESNNSSEKDNIEEKSSDESKEDKNSQKESEGDNSKENQRDSDEKNEKEDSDKSNSKKGDKKKQDSLEDSNSSNSEMDKDSEEKEGEEEKYRDDKNNNNNNESDIDETSKSEYREEVLNALEQIDQMVERSFKDLGKVNRAKGEDVKEEGW